MLINRARFNNYRMLTDIEVDFSTNKEKPLTIIRAQNESGKTTMLRALQWALFGEEVLPNKGKGHRLHHIKSKAGQEIKISVEIEFTHHWKRSPLLGRQLDETKSYVLKRTVYETVERNDWNRKNDELELFEIKSQGYTPISNPKDRLKLILGSNLKDLFFTDGDDALRFIEGKGSASSKREHVRKAIRDMLSFDVLKDAQRHVKICDGHFRRESQKYATTKISEYFNAMEKLDETIENETVELESLQSQLQEADNELTKIDRQISEILKLGDKHELQKRREICERLEKEIENNINIQQKTIASLFYSDTLGSVLCSEKIKDTNKYLNELKNKGIIPKASLPFLKELLDNEKDCICGRPLKKGSDHYKKLEVMIKEQAENNEFDDRVTQLRGLSQSYIDNKSNKEDFKESLDIEIKSLLGKNTTQADCQAEIKDIENQIDKIPDSDLIDLRETERVFRDTSSLLKDKANRKRYELDSNKRDYEYIKKQHDIELKKQKSAKKTLAKLSVSRDILKVLEAAYNKIESEEIPKVSNRLNELFLQMIKAGDNKIGLIRETRINDQYDIEVFGPNNREYNTTDLNGASRRALTLAFIMSLADVSEFVAPNVIDTPFGMMDEIIKKSCLETLVKECKQVVLFLTRSEINDIEELLDKYTGCSSTITNTAHYPAKGLVNDNGSSKERAILCNCDHNQYCNICELSGDKNNKKLKALS